MGTFLYKIFFFILGIACSILIFKALWHIVIKKAIDRFNEKKY